MRVVPVALFVLSIIFANSALAQQYTSPEQIPAEAFAALPQNSGVKLSPNGQNVLYISKYQGKRVVVVTPLSSSSDFEGVAIPPYDTMDIRWARWANDDYILVSMSFEAERHSSLGKELFTRLISVPIRNPKKAKNMAEADRSTGDRGLGNNKNEDQFRLDRIQDSVVDILPDDPDHFLLAFNSDTDPAREVRMVDVEKGTYRIVHDPSGFMSSWGADYDGVVRVGTGRELSGGNLSDVRDLLMFRDPDTGEWIDHTGNPKVDFDNFEVIAMSSDPHLAYVRTLNENGFWALYLYDMVKLEPAETLVSFDDRDVQGVLDDPYTGRVIGALYFGNGNEYVYFDETYAKYHKMVDKALTGTIEFLVSRTADGNRYLVSSRADVDSQSYYLFDATTKQLAFLQAEYPGLDPRLMSPMEGVTYTTRDGVEIEAYLTIPVGTDGKNLPTVILPHGGPATQDSWTFDYQVQFLASRGYVVLQPNYRGSTGYGKDFEEAGRRQWGLKMQDDITDGALWLIEQGIADPERMCIFGGSYGGYAALTAAFTTPDLFKCAASVNGISDLHRMVTQESGFVGVKQWGELIGDPTDRADEERMKATSAINNIDRIKIPVLVIAAKDDTVVNYQQSKRFFDEMKDKGKAVEYIELEEGNHWSLTEPPRMAILQTLEKFLARHIGKGR